MIMIWDSNKILHIVNDRVTIYIYIAFVIIFCDYKLDLLFRTTPFNVILFKQGNNDQGCDKRNHPDDGFAGAQRLL